jgi:hypothetical protein
MGKPFKLLRILGKAKIKTKQKKLSFYTTDRALGFTARQVVKEKDPHKRSVDVGDISFLPIVCIL